MNKDIMIDIETMGNTHNAAMIQLGAARFNRDTGEITDTFLENISLEDCENYNFETNQSTKDWWAEQNQDVLNDILSNAKLVKPTINAFSKFFNEDDIIWSHATFDFVIVQNYLKKFKCKQFPFRGARDIRTLVDLSGIDLDSYDWDKKTHNALDDCKFQIEYCVDAIAALKT